VSNIVISGGAGSLGKAFVKYLHKDHEVVVLDSNEWAVAELRKEFPDVQVQLKDFEKYSFNQTPCDLLIHCAAYKHVNLGEENPHDFIDNNIVKTGKLFAECYKFGVDILFISTDKAVEPISLYGYTKAIGEKLAKHYRGKIVRLGNLLDSNGSVIPVWEKAITENKPIPITDMKMVRYVIDVDDAVKQIWKNRAKDLIVPKCKEITIIEMLGEVFKKKGLKLHDYKPGIEIIGIRPGEKIKEQLYWDKEINKGEKCQK
jgi:FlaA1/EpsC-like NDP-sugar epimerase